MGPFFGVTVHDINELLIGGMVPWVTVISATLKNKWMSTPAVNDLDQIKWMRPAISLFIVLAEMHTVAAFCIHFGVSQAYT